MNTDANSESESELELESATATGTDAQPAPRGPKEVPATRRPGVPKRKAEDVRGHDTQDPVVLTAVGRAWPQRQDLALAHAALCAKIAADNRGKNILLIDIRPVTSLVDFFVIVSTPSRRLAQTIAEDVDKEMKRRNDLKLSVEGAEEGRWILIDYGDFVVHVMSEEAREYYLLEDIWADGIQLDWKAIAAQPIPDALSAPAQTPAQTPTSNP